MSGLKPGLFGKLPAKGDFVTRNLPATVVQPIEEWLQKVMTETRQGMGPAWVEAWMVAPIWRFWIGPDVFGTACAGAIMPSVDRVGRHFPLALVLADTGRGMPPPPVIAGFDSWYGRLEARLLSALDRDAIADLDTLLEGLDPEGPPAPLPEPAPPPPPRPEAQRPPLPLETAFDTAFTLSRDLPDAAAWAAAPFAARGSAEAGGEGDPGGDGAAEPAEAPEEGPEPGTGVAEQASAEADGGHGAAPASPLAPPAGGDDQPAADLPASPDAVSDPALKPGRPTAFDAPSPFAAPAERQAPATPAAPEAPSPVADLPDTTEPAPAALLWPSLPRRAEDPQRALWAGARLEIGGGGVAALLEDVRAEEMLRAAAGRSYWWTAGAAPALIALAGLPDAAAFRLMLCGGHPERLANAGY